MVAARRIQHTGEVWTKMPRGEHNTRVDGVWTRKEAIRQKIGYKTHLESSTFSPSRHTSFLPAQEKNLILI